MPSVATVRLYAPRTYVTAGPVERARHCNGCGPNGWQGKLIPDTVYGLSIKPACDIHDWMYHEGVTESDRDNADLAFLNNMQRLVDAAGGWGVLRWLRYRRVAKYHRAVREHGSRFFWAGKNPREELWAVSLS